MTLIDKAEARKKLDDLERFSAREIAEFAEKHEAEDAERWFVYQHVYDAIAALPERGVGVKPLQWTRADEDDGVPQWVSGIYFIRYTAAGYKLRINGIEMPKRYLGDDGDDQAKVDANKDNEARILAALDMTNVQKMHVAFLAPTDAAHLNGPAEAVTMSSTIQPCTWPTCGCTAKGQFCEAPVRWFPQPALAAQAREAALDAIKMGFLSAAPGEWRVSDIERVTEAILRAMEGRG